VSTVIKKARPLDITIGDATEQDFAEIQSIYAPYVLNTSVSLEDVPPSVEEMKNRWHSYTDKGFPYIVAKAGGRVVGYAYASPYRTRSAYRFTVEESVYVADGFHGMGIGQQLMQALVAACRDKGFKQMIAIIGDSDNIPSIKFHEALGFVHAGTLHQVGFKFGKWTDTIRMQKTL
jgi:phosphinothricin acetyltransferase